MALKTHQSGRGFSTFFATPINADDPLALKNRIFGGAPLKVKNRTEEVADLSKSNNRHFLPVSVGYAECSSD